MLQLSNMNEAVFVCTPSAKWASDIDEETKTINPEKGRTMILSVKATDHHDSRLFDKSRDN